MSLHVFVILGVPGLFCRFYSFDGKNLLANNIDPDQTPQDVASDLCLHCLLMTLLRVSSLEWVKHPGINIVNSDTLSGIRQLFVNDIQ